MSHYEQWRCREQASQRLHAVNEHIARTASHKHFHSAHSLLVQLLEKVDIVVRSTEEERVVHRALLGSQAELILKRLKRCGLRHSVRHLHIRSDTAGSSRTALRRDVCLVGQSWFAKMHMVVYDTWQQIHACSVNNFIARLWFDRTVFHNVCNKLPVNNHRCFEGAPFVHNRRVIYYCPHLH